MKGENASRPAIMVVDDSVANLKFTKSALAEIYDVFTAPSAAKMLALLETVTPALILLDIDMPEMNGCEAIRRLKEAERTRDIPVIFLTGNDDPGSEMNGLELGAVDYIAKPFETNLLRKRIDIHLTLEGQKRVLESQKRELEYINNNLQKLVEEKAGKVLELQGAILVAVADLVESRDDITGGHVERAQRWLGILLRELLASGLYRAETRDWDSRFLLQSSQLHDVGKIAVRDSILRKPGKLTKLEFEEMKLHVTFGVRIIEKMQANISESDFLRHAKLFAGTHHEKWDGSGYPQGLRGKAIPLQGRLMAIADVYDALISDRPYKKALTHGDALSILIEERGTHFDPALIGILEQTEGRFIQPQGLT